MTADLTRDLNEVIKLISQKLETNEQSVMETFRQVASGELEIVETITPHEKLCLRILLGFMAVVGLQNVWERLKPLLIGGGPLPEPMPSNEDMDLSAISVGFQDLLKDYKDLGDPPINVWVPPSVEDVKKVIQEILAADKRQLTRFGVLILSYVFYDDFHYPQPETAYYNISGQPFEKVKWLYRYWFNQLEVAEKGSDLEDFFAAQSLTIHQNLAPLGKVRKTWSTSLSCGGDLLAVDCLKPENTPHLFDGITDFFSTADIVSANLESTVSDKIKFGRTQAKGQPAKMNTNTEMFDKFRHEAKINFFSTATNHALDWGEEGVLSTLDVLEASGAQYAGTAKSQAEQDDIVIVDKDGFKVALLAYTFDLNGYAVPAGKPYMANVVRFNDADPAPDYSLIEKQVALAKAKGAEHIVAYCHWGWEFEMYPHVNIVEAAHKVIACGVDTILGNHPHVSQPAQLIKREGKLPALVIYAFGDFVSFHPESRNSKLAYLVKFDIKKVAYGYSPRMPPKLPDAFPTYTTVTNLEALPIYIVNEKLGKDPHTGEDSYNCRIVKFNDVLKAPDDYGLTELEKSQLPHLKDKVWNDILSPLAGVMKKP